MTWQNVIFGIGVIMGWAIGIAIIQYPGGVWVPLLRATARLGLKLMNKWFHDACTHTPIWAPIWGGITCREYYESMAKDPKGTVWKYLSWTIPLAFLMGLVWLSAALRLTQIFFKSLKGGG